MIVKRIVAKLLKPALIRRSPVVLPMFQFATGARKIDEFRRHATNHKHQRFLWIKVIAFQIYWPFRSFVLAITKALDNDRGQSDTGVSRSSLFWKLWRAMLRHNTTPEEFFEFKLWSKDNPLNGSDFVQHHEIVNALKWLNQGEDRDAIDNKFRFDYLCRRHQIPNAPVVSQITKEDIELFCGDTLPPKNLFTKINGRWGGSLGLIWEYDATSKTWSNENNRFDQKQLLSHLQASAGRFSVVVQQQFVNGQNIAQFSSGALCTIRVVTFKLEPDKAEYIQSALRMPIGTMSVDNFGAGGLAAVFREDETLSKACRKYHNIDEALSHPDTNAQIAGVRLQDWREAVALAIKAHNQLTDISGIGWDVAATQDGVILIEGNVGFGVDVLQVPESTPLSDKFFDRYFAARDKKDAT